MSGRALRPAPAPGGPTPASTPPPRSSTSISTRPSSPATTGPTAVVPGRELPKLAEALSHQLGPETVVWRALVAPEGFDARKSAIARRYRYDLEARRPGRIRCGARPSGTSTAPVDARPDAARRRRGCSASTTSPPSAAGRRTSPTVRSGAGSHDARLTTAGEGLVALRDRVRRLLPPDGALDRRRARRRRHRPSPSERSRRPSRQREPGRRALAGPARGALPRRRALSGRTHGDVVVARLPRTASGASGGIMAPRTDGGASRTRSRKHTGGEGQREFLGAPYDFQRSTAERARSRHVESRRPGPVPAEELRVGLDRELLLVRAPVALVRAPPPTPPT